MRYEMSKTLNGNARYDLAKKAIMVVCLLAVTLSVLVVRPAAADDKCKPASPLPQAKCVKDAQCCASPTTGW